MHNSSASVSYQSVVKDNSLKDLLLMSLLEVSAELVWIRDFPAGSFQCIASPEQRKKYSIPDTIKDDFWVSQIHPEEIAAVLELFHSALHDKNISTLELEYRLRHGPKAVYIRDKLRFIRDEGGRATKLIGIWHDMTAERSREKTLRKALQYQFSLNEELAKREQTLRTAEEKLQDTNRQLLENLRQLSEREFILEKTQKIAGIGNWEYHIRDEKLIWSEGTYSIYGIDPGVDLGNGEELDSLFLPSSLAMIREAFFNVVQGVIPEFDLYCELVTPVGYRKNVRIVGYLDEENPGKIIGLNYDVTYIKEAASRLRSSEEKFAKAFRNHPDLIMIVREKDHMVVDLNDKILPVLGYAREEVAGKDISTLNPFVYEDERRDFVQRTEISSAVQMEVQWRRKDGRIIYVVLSTIRIEVESTSHFLFVVRDTSDMKVAEAKFQKAFEVNPDVVAIVRKSDGVFVEVNDKIEQVTGFTREEVLGKDASTFAWWVNQVEDLPGPNLLTRGFDIPIKRKNGTEFFASHAFSNFKMSGDDYLIGSIRDVTERTMYENKIRLNEANLNAIINNTRMLIVLVDRAYTLMAINASAGTYVKDHYGISLTPGNSIHSDALPLPFQNDLKDWLPMLRLAFRGKSFNIVAQLYDRIFSFSFNPIIDKSKVKGVSVFAEDVTERVSKEKELNAVRGRIAELRLVALRSAMNPHFIFNALNSIQYFMAKNDRVNAINYLSTFSKLIRKILESSIHTRVRLCDELELLRYYVNLELVRFDKKFSFHMTVDEDIDTQLVHVPSLLIQPYVENAILHGLYNKDGAGTLLIKVKRTESDILFLIQDDGIGRKAAAEVKNNAGIIHRSIGSELTSERLALINTDNKVSLEIEDLYELEKPAGTRVTITVAV